MAPTNNLASETSPYLLQHAHNPVNWYPWSDEALNLAKLENKPILVSIGYAACHWCHVMERESFEDVETAKIMNDFFVNIKIDREERPDLDHIYMDAVQAMTGSGGWPLNVFLTPECKPFYGGTYFPPQAMFNRPSWKDVLYGVASAYRKTPDEIRSQAENLTAHILESNAFGQVISNDTNHFTKENLHLIFQNIMKTADRADGGFGKAPKFPQTFSIQYLLSYSHIFKNREALDQACLTLDKMINGGIYDQIGGGFSRYATDGKWLVPHFEKMLYDNALLVSVLCDAYQLTRHERYADTIRQTLTFIERELMSEEFGFYSALDADSEGVEGKFYVWDKAEIENLLNEDAELFSEYFDVSVEGNWEGRNILNIAIPIHEFAKARNYDTRELSNKLKIAADTLLNHRNLRIRPQLDDKTLLGWNALMNIAYTKAFGALGEEIYRITAEKNMQFLLKKFRNTSHQLFHTYKAGRGKFPAFLDDYAYLIQALLHLQEVTGNIEYLTLAKQYTEYVLDNFQDVDSELFFYTPLHQKDVVVRKKEIYDGAVPSGNSIMAWNLLYLAVIYENNDWKRKVEEMLKPLAKAITTYPTSFGAWAEVMNRVTNGVDEIVLVGSDNDRLHKEILHIFIPNKILQLSTQENNDFPLLKGKTSQNQPLIFLCKNYMCKSPVDNLNALIRLLENNANN